MDDYGKCGCGGFSADSATGPVASDPSGSGHGRSLVGNRQNEVDVFCTPYRLGVVFTDGMGYPSVCDYDEIFAPLGGAGH